jgi:hypothetical protein
MANEPSDSIKEGYFFTSQKPLVPEEGLCSTELLTSDVRKSKVTTFIQAGIVVLRCTVMHWSASQRWTARLTSDPFCIRFTWHRKTWNAFTFLAQDTLHPLIMPFFCCVKSWQFCHTIYICFCHCHCTILNFPRPTITDWNARCRGYFWHCFLLLEVFIFCWKKQLGFSRNKLARKQSQFSRYLFKLNWILRQQPHSKAVEILPQQPHTKATEILPQQLSQKQLVFSRDSLTPKT